MTALFTVYADENLLFCVGQARLQNNVTGGAEINFGGARKVFIYVNSKGARGHEKFIRVRIKRKR